jgi:NitT/TauT family transport system ATP-binding protein/nitrate/nitrite transport system substrate-binding protein
LGFIPLTDAAALLVGRAGGFFANEGLRVDLSREASWATLRDKLSVGTLDGAHMLAPLLLATRLGIGCESADLIAPLALNRGGAAVTLSIRLAGALGEDGDADRLATLIARRRNQGSSRLTFGVVFPFSTHNYLLRDWMARAGIDPNRDVRLTVVPPERTADLLADGVIDGFCAGAPWSDVAIRAGVGQIAMRSSRFAPEAPDKVFAVAQAWAAANGAEFAGLLRALLRASAWSQDPANRGDLLALLARPENVGVNREAIAAGLDEIRFNGGVTNRPDVVQGQWLLDQMARWGQHPGDPDVGRAAAQAFRPDLFDQARAALRA